MKSHFGIRQISIWINMLIKNIVLFLDAKETEQEDRVLALEVVCLSFSLFHRL